MYLPEKLRIVVKRSIKVTSDDGQELSVRPAFFQNFETDPGTARRWGGRGAEILEASNEPFRGLHLTTLEHRAEGGRAYKVLTCDGYYVDLREDTLMEILLYSSVEHGRLQGEFVWGIAGSQTKLVLVGSPTHHQMVEGSKRRKLKKIPNKQLEIGGVYQTKSGNAAVFLGWLKERNSRKRAMVWFDVTRYQYGMDNHVSWEEAYQGRLQRGYSPEIKKSQSFVEKVDQINVAPVVIRHLSGGTPDQWQTLLDENQILESIRPLLSDKERLSHFLQWLPRPMPGVIEDYLKEQDLLRLIAPPRVRRSSRSDAHARTGNAFSGSGFAEAARGWDERFGH